MDWLPDRLVAMREAALAAARQPFTGITWSNISPFVMRHGLLLEDLSESQRAAALAIVEASLSATGYRTARDVMRLNYTIGELTGAWDEYGEFVYFLTIFGNPSSAEPWGWQLDGHHCNLNCFVLGDQLVLSPAFLGSEPVYAESGKYAGTRVFEREERLGLQAMRALNSTQRAAAMLESRFICRWSSGSWRYPTTSSWRFSDSSHSSRSLSPGLRF